MSRALLRLYLVFPDRAAARCVCRALLRALQHDPPQGVADFWLLLHLVPERMQGDDGVAALITLAGHLEGCRFRDFWAAAASPAAQAATAAAPGFEDAARRYALRALGSVYRALPAAQLADALRLEAAALPGWLRSAAAGAAGEGWALEGDTATAPRSEGNDPQPQTGGESIPFSKLEGLFKSAPAAKA